MVQAPVVSRVDKRGGDGMAPTMEIRDGDGMAPAMEIRIDGHLVINVKHLQWKFRGNECIVLVK
ncbi:hypothetical protein Hanom_Chr10g00942291 [Helianthus anomalus]